MSLDECLTVIEILAGAYPGRRGFETDAACIRTAKVWQNLLSDLPVQAVLMAVEKHCICSVYPPTVAEIRTVISEAVHPDLQLAASDAWGEVTRAVRMYGMYQEERALQSLSERTRRVVKSMGWRELCSSEEVDVIRGQFRKAYEGISVREKQDALLPDRLKRQIALVGQGGLRLLVGE